MAFNANFLYPTSFVLKLSKLPNVEFSCQSVTIPGINLGDIARPTPFSRLTEKGNIQYQNFAVNFLVQSDLSNYLEIFNWMLQLGYPHSYTETDHTEYDARIVILDANKKTCDSLEVHFTDVFPTSLSDIVLDSSIQDPTPILVTATFAYDRMNFSK